MQTVHDLFRDASNAYGSGSHALAEVKGVCARCHEMLATRAAVKNLGSAGGKQYYVFTDGARLSRPFLSSLYESDHDKWRRSWDSLVAAVDPGGRRFATSADSANAPLYTAITAFSAAYDLWKPTSRKTPGTVFEIILGSFLQHVLSDYQREKHVILEGETENVATDIVFTRPGRRGGLVIPAKITTRERIVQPFAHQRILESFFGEGKYRSVLVCVSEMQRDKTRGANEICVPGALRLYQKHLATMSGIYYLDPPSRYLQKDVTDWMPVATVGVLLTSDLPNLLP